MLAETQQAYFHLIRSDSRPAARCHRKSLYLSCILEVTGDSYTKEVVSKNISGCTEAPRSSPTKPRVCVCCVRVCVFAGILGATSRRALLAGSSTVVQLRFPSGRSSLSGEVCHQAHRSSEIDHRGKVGLVLDKAVIDRSRDSSAAEGGPRVRVPRELSVVAHRKYKTR